MRAPSSFPGLARLFATLALIAIAACTPKPEAPVPTVVAPPPPPAPIARNPLDRDQPSFLRLPNVSANATPVRVGIILPLTSSSPGTRALAASMLKAAELALYNTGNRQLLLMTADEGSTPGDAANAARKLLDQGAEVIVGPLFGTSVAAVAPIARDRAVPVIAFSTEKNVAGNGVYLVSFLPGDEIRQVVRYAARHGHNNFAAMVPDTPYGDVAGNAFTDAVKTAGGRIADVEHFIPNGAALQPPAQAIAKSGADAVLIAQGGTLLKALAPTLSLDGLARGGVKLLGTGLWDDNSLASEPSLSGGWFAAPEPQSDDAFVQRYRAAFGTAPAQLAPLAYDAISLVALLSNGVPYHRFTQVALMDSNGFTGVNGIFRFRADGTAERGLAILQMTPQGPQVVAPAPKTFQNHGS